MKFKKMNTANPPLWRGLGVGQYKIPFIFLNDQTLWTDTK
jgi:hypothetical protein